MIDNPAESLTLQKCAATNQKNSSHCDRIQLTRAHKCYIQNFLQPKILRNIIIFSI